MVESTEEQRGEESVEACSEVWWAGGWEVWLVEVGDSVEAVSGRLGVQAEEAAAGREVAGAALLADAAEAAAKVEEVCGAEKRAVAEKDVEVRAMGRSEEVAGDVRAVQMEAALEEAWLVVKTAEQMVESRGGAKVVGKVGA
jgi:hypothetical protein